VVSYVHNSDTHIKSLHVNSSNLIKVVSGVHVSG